MGGGQSDDFARVLQDENRTLRLRLEELTKERDAALEARDNLEARCAELHEQVQHLLDRLFGKRTEKLSNHPQLPFPGDDAEQPVPPHVLEAPDDEASATRKRRRRRRRPQPRKDLPVERVEIELPESERVCSLCHEVMQPFGESATQRFDYVPAVVKIREYAVIKYSCPCCEIGVKAARVPPAVIEGGVAEPGLLAQVVVAKYCDHLPLERQERIFERHGIELSKSTMCDWIGDVTNLFVPIVNVVKGNVLASHVVNSDDTRLVVLDRAAPGGSRTGYLWVYVGDRGDVVFDFTRTRGGEGPRAFLGGFSGYLQADAYSGYDAIFASGKVVEAGCWAHARRRFFEAAKLGSEVAVQVLQVIRGLYAIEREATDGGFTPDQRLALRQEKARPLLDAAEPWLRAKAEQALPSSLLGKAFTYCLNQWTSLKRYIEDGRLAIDNNIAEREMRRVAVGRKNWEFAGSDEGAKRAAILYSLIATCQRVGVEPWAYLTDVLRRISSHPANRVAELAPRAWKEAQPKLVLVDA